MKMTRLEWAYLQRIALDHPYYDTHKPPLSDAEARAIVEANNTVTGREFVDSIYAKLGITRPEEKKERFAWLRNMGELFAVPPIRKIAIAILVVLLMAVFLTATPTGRAIAESVLRYFSMIDDSGHLIVERSDNDTIIYFTNEGKPAKVEWRDVENSITHIGSFDDFTETTGKTPVILPLPFTELFIDNDESIGILQLLAIYNTEQGQIITIETWGAEDWFDTTETGFSVYDEDGPIYYSIEEDGRIVISIVFEDSIFSMNVKGSYTLESLVEMLNE